MSEEQAAASVDVPRETTPTAEVNTDQNPEVSATPEGATPEATPQADKPATDDTPRKPSNSKFDRKIDRLNRAIGEQKARADYLQQQLEAAIPKPGPAVDGLRLEDFDFDVERYAEAKAKKAEESALKRYGEEQQTQTRKQAEIQLTKSWESKTSKAERKYDDFDEVVGELAPTSHINIAIMQAENGDEIAYYLGQNLNDARRIAALDPISAIREIGRLEAKLLAEPPKAKEPSKAPAPITPVKGSSSANKTIFDDGLSQAEWEKVRTAQLKRR